MRELRLISSAEVTAEVTDSKTDLGESSGWWSRVITYGVQVELRSDLQGVCGYSSCHPGCGSQAGSHWTE